MTLPAGQRRALEEIERELQASEPRLASAFAVFTRVVAPDGPISVERIRPRLRHSPSFPIIALIPIAVAMLIAGLILSGTGRGSSECFRARAPVASVPGGAIAVSGRDPCRP